jgi:hypothetical protein
MIGGLIVGAATDSEGKGLYGGLIIALAAAGICAYFCYASEAETDAERAEFVQQMSRRFTAGIELVPLHGGEDARYVALTSGEMCDYRDSGDDGRRRRDDLQQCVLFAFREPDGGIQYASAPLSRVRMRPVPAEETPRAEFVFRHPSPSVPELAGLQWALEEALDRMFLTCRPGECNLEIPPR